MTMTGLVYRAFDTTNGKSYVGQTTGLLEDRIASHFSPNSNCLKFLHALRKRPQAFIWTVVTRCPSLDELNAAEAYWVNFFNCVYDGYNLRFGGGSQGRLSDETRRKMSVARTNNPANKGWKLRPEHYRSQAETRKLNLAGRDPFSAEARKLSHLAQVGSKHSEATRKKMSESQKTRRKREREAL